MGADQCKRCGAFIGLIGRLLQLFGPLAPHRCRMTHGLNHRTAGYEGEAVVKPKSPKPNNPGEA